MLRRTSKWAHALAWIALGVQCRGLSAIEPPTPPPGAEQIKPTQPEAVALERVRAAGRHSYAITADGALDGNFLGWKADSGKDQTKARLYLIQRGEIVHRVLSQSDGRVLAEKLRPGVYDVVGIHPQFGVSLFSIRLTADTRFPQEDRHPRAQTIAAGAKTVDALLIRLIAQTDVRQLLQIFGEHFANQLPRQLTPLPTSSTSAYQSRGGYAVSESAVRNVSFQDRRGNPQPNTSQEFVEGRVDAFESDGSLAPFAHARVFLVHQGRTMAVAQSNDDGQFLFPNTGNKDYSIIIVGQKGLAAFGSILISKTGKVERPAPVANASLRIADGGTPIRLAAANAQFQLPNEIAVITPANLARVAEILEAEGFQLPGMGLFPPAGAAPLGGGAGGGGGGLAGLLGLAGLAAGLGALLARHSASNSSP